MRNRPQMHYPSTYVPPASAALSRTEPVSASVVSGDVEVLNAIRRVADLPQDGSELQVARTTRPSTGVDVYIAGPPITFPPVGLQVRVYAIVGDLRTLVDCVFVHRLDSFTAPQWVATARCAAEAFEVTVSTNLGAGGSGVADDRFMVSLQSGAVMATPPDDVGVWKLVHDPMGLQPLQTVLSSGIVAGLIGAFTVAMRDLRLVALEVHNTNVAVRYLQIYDQFGPAGAPVAANLRQSIRLAAGEARRIDFPRSLRDRYRNGLQFEESTTAIAFAGGGSDIVFTAWVK